MSDLIDALTDDGVSSALGRIEQRRRFGLVG
jgi:hypothetical protein